MTKNVAAKSWSLDVIDGRRYSIGERSGFYSTEFNLDENPVDEDGVWLNAGGTLAASWQGMQTDNGRLFGQNFVTAYDDGISIIDPAVIPFNVVQRIRARIHFQSGYTPIDTHEAQLLLNVQLFDDDTLEGYEFLLDSVGDYPLIVKWRGGPEDFFALLTLDEQNAIGFQDGDYMIVERTSGNVLTAYRERAGVVTLWSQATDNGTVKGAALTGGQPGVASFVRPNTGQVLENFCFDYFEATHHLEDFE